MSSVDDDAPQDAHEEEPGERTATVPEDPTGTEHLLGRRIAQRYTLEALLGIGTLGPTFRARRDDDQPVVIKLLQPAWRGDETLKRRLARGAAAAAKLDHLHIAHVFEHGVDESEGPFVCRELLEGEQLLKAAWRSTPTPRRICNLTIQMLSGLSEAHRLGVLHRNLKPQNVWVVPDANGRDCVKLCDFGGLLRAHVGAEYQAPEQGEGLPVDGQADVYAVGVMLYELLTDEVPFRGATSDETLALHKRAPVVPPRQKRPDRPIPRELEAICLKALAKEPRERHRSPRAMASALRAALGLLDTRADEPLGSTVFAEVTVPPPALEERMTMPGEQLRSSTKLWLGAGLLVAVCAAVLINPEGDRSLDRASGSAPVAPSPEQLTKGELALQSGRALLRHSDAQGAVAELRNAQRALGDTPAVLRALGEALVQVGQSTAGAAMLSRYLELVPDAPDREFVETIVRHGQQQQAAPAIPPLPSHEQSAP